MKKKLENNPKRSSSVLKARQEQRTKMQEDLSYLTPFLEEWFWQNEEMKNARPYQNSEFRKQRWKKGRNDLLGSPDSGYGELQKRMDKEMDGILLSLKKDMPSLAERDFFAYTYFAAGFDNTLVAHLVGLSSAQDAAALKNHFKDTFLKMNSERKFEYLELLPYRQQPNVQRNSES